MLHDLWNVPYVHFLCAGITASIIALVRSTLEGVPPTSKKRLLDAILCGASAVSLTWLAWRYAPNNFDYMDSIPYSIPLGFFGAGKIFDYIARRFLRDANNEKK